MFIKVKGLPLTYSNIFFKPVSQSAMADQFGKQNAILYFAESLAEDSANKCTLLTQTLRADGEIPP